MQTKADQRLTLTVARCIQQGHLMNYHRQFNEEFHAFRSSAKIYSQTGQISKTKVVTVEQAAEGGAPDKTHSLLFSIKINGSSTTIIPEMQRGLSKKLIFLPLRTPGKFSSRVHMFVDDDLIKMGNVMLRKVKLSDEQKRQQKTQNIGRQKQGACCRICLMQDEPEGLIEPCQCKGSCQYVHTACLRTWLKSKVVKIESKNVTSYQINNMNCQLCKTSFAERFSFGNNWDALLQIQRPKDKRYLVLQGVSQREKRIFIVHGNVGEEIVIGRANQCLLRLTDISISRRHAAIQIGEKGFFLRDLQSRFGTLVEIQNSLELQKQIQIQMDEKIYKFSREYIHPRARVYLE